LPPHFIQHRPSCLAAKNTNHKKAKASATLAALDVGRTILPVLHPYRVKRPPHSRLHPLAQLDLAYHWHPFTQMRDWLQQEPVVIVSGKGAILHDLHGRSYLDANSSIWTNLHGHRHPVLNLALRRQLAKIAHTSALGLANEPAAILAERLVHLASPTSATADNQPGFPLRKVFYTDDGSTAMEVALKLAYEFARRTGHSRKPRFLSLHGAYHGDTVGAVSLGHIDLFHRAYSGLLFKSDSVMAPYCYRCPYNRAEPERADARLYRRCDWECVDQVEQRFALAQHEGRPYAAFVVEPRIQGAAGMIPQPEGWLPRVATIARTHGAQLIADEVMTGFGRTGGRARNAGAISRTQAAIVDPQQPQDLFASVAEGVQPDYLVLAKGLTGGYLPMAATLTTQPVFDAFLGEYEEFKTFFHGHSYTANPLGAATALASLNVLESQSSRANRSRLASTLQEELASLWSHPAVGDIRQVGTVVGVELVRNWRTREPFALRERAGIRVCATMARHGVLTRPVGNVIVLMPPYCTTPGQARRMVGTLRRALEETL
jgi:adenosylmethionine---8-amino-7-oxononanoate aminotransferase